MYMSSEHMQKKLFFIQKLYIYLNYICSNMFQNDNVTNDLIHGLVNDNGFEDTAISRVKT